MPRPARRKRRPERRDPCATRRALRGIEAFRRRIGSVGHETETVEALRANYRGHDRVVILSGMQAFAFPGRHMRGTVSGSAPPEVPLFGVNTTGYSATTIESGAPNRYEIGGFSDRLFTMMSLLSRGRDAGWPWES